jgi:DNA-binding response OmpR family regulator
MVRILIVSDTRDAFQELAAALKDDGIDIQWAHDSRTALERVAGDGPELVIVDEIFKGLSGMEWVRRIIQVNAFVQTALVSRLSQDDFHEASEGLGILMQFPDRPDRDDARHLVAALRRLAGGV